MGRQRHRRSRHHSIGRVQFGGKPNEEPADTAESTEEPPRSAHAVERRNPALHPTTSNNPVDPHAQLTFTRSGNATKETTR